MERKSGITPISLADLIIRILYSAMPAHIFPCAELDIKTFIYIYKNKKESLKAYRNVVEKWIDSTLTLMNTQWRNQFIEANEKEARQITLDRVADHFKILRDSTKEILETLHALTKGDKTKLALENTLELISTMPVLGDAVGLVSILQGFKESIKEIKASDLKGAIDIVRHTLEAKREFAQGEINKVIKEYFQKV